jgi:hypothetical protein
MNKRETAQMLVVMRAAYPKFYSGVTAQDTSAALELWADAFREIPAPIALEAMRRRIRESPYPPAVADVYKRVEAMRGLEKDGPEELWAKLCKAAQRGYYNAREEFAALPEPCQRFCGTPEGLKLLAMMDEELFSTVTRGQFMRRIEMLQTQAEMRSTLPDGLREMAASIGKPMPQFLLDKLTEH